MKDVIDLTKTYYSGDYYLTVSNEIPMTRSGKIYCKFDLIKNKNSFYGAPVNQFGSVEEILDTLKCWKQIDAKPEYACLKEINSSKHRMEDDFIDILQALGLKLIE